MSVQMGTQHNDKDTENLSELFSKPKLTQTSVFTSVCFICVTFCWDSCLRIKIVLSGQGDQQQAEALENKAHTVKISVLGQIGLSNYCRPRFEKQSDPN